MNQRRENHVSSINPKGKLPVILVGMFFWIVLMIMIFFVDPVLIVDFGIKEAYLIFFILESLAVFFTLGLLLGSSRKGVFSAIVVTGILFLRLKGIGTVFNSILLILFFVVLEMFLSSKS